MFSLGLLGVLGVQRLRSTGCTIRIRRQGRYLPNPAGGKRSAYGYGMKKHNRNQEPSTRRPETESPRGGHAPTRDRQARPERRNDDVEQVQDDGERKNVDEEGEDEDEALERP